MRSGGIKMGEKANTNVEDVKPNEIDILGRDEFVDNCRLFLLQLNQPSL